MLDEEYMSEELHLIKLELNFINERFLRVIKFAYKGNEILTESNEDRVRTLNFLLKGYEMSEKNSANYKLSDLKYLNINLHDK